MCKLTAIAPVMWLSQDWMLLNSLIHDGEWRRQYNAQPNLPIHKHIHSTHNQHIQISTHLEEDHESSVGRASLPVLRLHVEAPLHLLGVVGLLPVRDMCSVYESVLYAHDTLTFQKIISSCWWEHPIPTAAKNLQPVPVCKVQDNNEHFSTYTSVPWW